MSWREKWDNKIKDESGRITQTKLTASLLRCTSYSDLVQANAMSVGSVREFVKVCHKSKGSYSAYIIGKPQVQPLGKQKAQVK